MSTRTQPRCSLCHQTGHNRRTCTHGKCKTQVVKLFKKEIVVSKILPKKPEPKKHNCTICMCDIETEKDSMCLPCGHHFHVTCGLKWLQENNTCPCCRAECGEKPKKLPILNTDVASALTGELLSSSNVLLDISQQNQAICEQPWNYPGYSRYLNERERAAFQASMGSYSRENDRDYTEEQLKENWNDETQATQIRLKCRFLYQQNAQTLSMFMLDGFASARAYQEGDFDLSAVLVNQPETGLVVQLPFAPTEAEEAYADTDTDTDMSIPALEEEDEEDEEIPGIPGAIPDFEEEEDELSLASIDVESFNNFTPTSMLDNVDRSILQTLEVDLPFTIEELEGDDIPTTPEPTPTQVPNAPRRRRRREFRSELQSPPASPRSVTVTSDEHVTRRSSARLRQRYRRRRLQEEQDYSLTM